MPVRILMVEDSALDAELAARELQSAGMMIEVRRVQTEPDMRRDLAEFDPHVILCDFGFPTFSRFAALELAQTVRPDIPFIFLSGSIREENVTDALERGAADCFV